MRKICRPLIAVGCLPWSTIALAGDSVEPVDLTHSGTGYAALAIFALAYLLVMAEEITQLRKSIPVVFAATLIWLLGAVSYLRLGLSGDLVYQTSIEHVVASSRLMLFLIAAMTYISVMHERRIFMALNAWLLRRGYSYRTLFWIIGFTTFFLSMLVNSLAIALVMCAVVVAVGKDSPRFIALSCISIVVAANAGGALSPFGSISTLMIFQKGVLGFGQLSLIFIPALLSFIVPAACMHFAVPDRSPFPSGEIVLMRRGSLRILALAVLTLCVAFTFRYFLHLPALMGMMAGFVSLHFLSYYLCRTHSSALHEEPPCDIFQQMAVLEWDTLLYIYGIILCIGGLDFIGYMRQLSQVLYVSHGPTIANVILGIISSSVDGAPLMYGVLSMDMNMTTGQWLLATLTISIGGSLLSIGSMPGVALMGQARGSYTFLSHLKWMPAIMLGYGVSVGAHMWLNATLF